MDIVKIIGLVAAGCTTVSFFPQAIKTIRTRDTRSISLAMYIILVVGVILWLAYGIMMNDLPIILANAITLAPTLVILLLKMNSKHRV